MMNVSLNPRGLQEETHNNEGTDCDITPELFLSSACCAVCICFTSITPLATPFSFCSTLEVTGKTDSISSTH